jgi:hypothetical protein
MTTNLRIALVLIFLVVALASCDIFLAPEPTAGSIWGYIFIGCLNIAVGAGIFAAAMYGDDPYSRDRDISQVVTGIAVLAGLIILVMFIVTSVSIVMEGGMGGGGGVIHVPPLRR